MTSPVSLTRHGHTTFLKWHRGRRTATDPVFTGKRIVEGMQAGASVEVDLVVTGDEGFAVLHNLQLEEETTGKGWVHEKSDATLRQLYLRANDGSPVSDRVMLLDDLCALLGKAPLPQSALLQLDYKQDATVLKPETIASFTRATAPIAHNLILSGGDAEAIDMLTKSVPGMRKGFDPSDSFKADALLDTASMQRFVDDALAAMPDADMIYLYWEIVIASAEAGFDMVKAFHDHARRIDAWTIQRSDQASIDIVNRLISLGVDQITMDDPEAIHQALAE